MRAILRGPDPHGATRVELARSSFMPIASPPGAASHPMISLRGISKAFPGVVANDGIDLDIHQSEIHAILGENGAGKSTLMKILYGFYRADSGRIFLDGRPFSVHSPSDALAAHVGMVLDRKSTRLNSSHQI